VLRWIPSSAFRLGAVVAAIVAMSCAGGESTTMAPTTSPLTGVAPEAWARLAQTRILFGHQSVGANIVDGVRDVLRSQPQIRLDIVEEVAGTDERPAFVHFAAGRNTQPLSKIEDFTGRLRASAVKPDVAFLKFCYIDVNAGTDVRNLFERYRTTMAELKSVAPQTRIVHLTVPLRVVQSDWKVPVKRLIGRPIGGYADNIRRNEYNDLLRAEYAGREPLFDLAAIQSARPGGGRMVFESNGKEYLALAPELTSDGGHLNEQGKRVVAEALLAELARIASTPAR